MEVRTGKGSKSNDLGFQNDSQIDDLGVPGGSGRGPRAPKSTPKGGPGGVREGAWLQVALGWVSGAGFARFGAPLGGGVPGPMLDHFGDIFVSFFLERFGHHFGTPLGSDFEANLDPKWGPKPPRKPS